eukprot:CAMPEP_0202480270 /NCGR_PEP_ID=MMETSP1361-20130828/329_1 /ASSEMBLY_ACC=CAM_ASM_000849 /TAXON_ID=210615 /ORGANISM="Staurosira complex sp., Strain CCMP2646" /LENGTH=122 /DNA_ID=CAMNT_0049107691 /DNA_START=94 /DNA_END=462 /DNA_ORIENTATION=-
MPGAARRINKSGEVVEGDDAQEDSPLLSGDRRIDVFGFNLDVRQFLITMALAYFMLGQQGLLVLLMALACYTLFVRVTSNGSSGSNSRGNNRRWGGGSRGGGGGGGPNIKGVKDLPCDPKGG